MSTCQGSYTQITSASECATCGRHFEHHQLAGVGDNVPLHSPALKPCPRTVCIYKPGTSISGVYCTYRYNGRMPCTGSLVCHTCGGRES